MVLLFILYCIIIFLIAIIQYFGKGLYDIQYRYHRLLADKDLFKPNEQFELFMLGTCVLSSIITTTNYFFIPTSLTVIDCKKIVYDKRTIGIFLRITHNINVISLTGTSCLQDVITSMDTNLIHVIEGQFHKGYYLYIEQIWPLLYKLIKNTTTTLYLTGHSMGGALVSILSYFISKEFPDKHVIVYTFGSPKYATETLERYTQIKTIHYLNEADPVIYKPLDDSLHRIGKQIMFNIDTGNDNVNHSLKIYKHVITRNNKSFKKRGHRFDELVARTVLDLFG